MTGDLNGQNVITDGGRWHPDFHADGTLSFNGSGLDILDDGGYV